MNMKVGTATDEALQVRLDIYIDEDPADPRSWDNAGVMVCWHNRYNLGDEQGFRDPDEFEEYWQEAGAGGLRLPLYLMDHSGLSMGCSDYGDPWDSGQVGWIYMSATDVAKEYGSLVGSDWYEKYHPGKTLDEVVIEMLKGEVETYSQYLEGQVYGFDLVSIEPNGDDGFGAYQGEGESIETCWGFYGDPSENGMKDYVSAKYRHLFDEVS